MAKKKAEIEIPEEMLMNKIYLIRGQKVMLDRDLADLYGVEVRMLNQAVKRNSERFPADFMFQLTKEEWESLRSQIVILKTGRGKSSKYLPYAFTEQGISMLSSVLNSETAIRVNIWIIRVFIKMLELIVTHKDILLQIEKLERRIAGHDGDIILIFQHIKKLLNPPVQPRERIGFRRKDEE